MLGWYVDLHELLEAWIATNEKHRANYPWGARIRRGHPDATTGLACLGGLNAFALVVLICGLGDARLDYPGYTIIAALAGSYALHAAVFNRAGRERVGRWRSRRIWPLMLYPALSLAFFLSVVGFYGGPNRVR